MYENTTSCFIWPERVITVGEYMKQEVVSQRACNNEENWIDIQGDFLDLLPN